VDVNVGDCDDVPVGVNETDGDAVALRVKDWLVDPEVDTLFVVVSDMDAVVLWVPRVELTVVDALGDGVKDAVCDALDETDRVAESVIVNEDVLVGVGDLVSELERLVDKDTVSEMVRGAEAVRDTLASVCVAVCVVDRDAVTVLVRVFVSLRLEVAVRDADDVGDGVCVTVGDLERVFDDDGEVVSVRVALDVPDGVAERDRVAVVVPVSLTVSEVVPLFVLLRDTVPVKDRVADGVCEIVPVRDTVPERDALDVPLCDTLVDADSDRVDDRERERVAVELLVLVGVNDTDNAEKDMDGVGVADVVRVTESDRVRDTDGVAVFDVLTLLVTVAVAGVVVFEPLVERE
jgi:hypothetical protein